MMCLRGNGTYPKITVLVHVWAQFTPGKLKIMPKKRFPKNCILSTIKLFKSQVSQKSQNSYIINQKTPFFGPKMDPNCPLEPTQRVNINSHIAYNRTIYPQFMDPLSLISGYLRSRLYSGEAPHFFGFVTQEGQFQKFQGNNCWSD